MSEAPGAPRALLFSSSSDRVEWWGVGATGRGVPHMAPWEGPACWSWCCGTGSEAGCGCQAGQVLSHLAAATPSPAISRPRPVRSALAGPSATESTNQEACGGAGSPVPWTPPRRGFTVPNLLPRLTLSWKEGIGGTHVRLGWWNLLNSQEWAIGCLNKDPGKGIKP